MKRSDRFIHRLEMPAQALQLLPLVEITGTNRALVENHHGIVQYTPQCIRIKVSFGSVCVTGTCLRLAYMSDTRMMIRGSIEGVQLHKGGV